MLLIHFADIKYRIICIFNGNKWLLKRKKSRLESKLTNVRWETFFLQLSTFYWVRKHGGKTSATVTTYNYNYRKENKVGGRTEEKPREAYWDWSLIPFFLVSHAYQPLTPKVNAKSMLVQNGKITYKLRGLGGIINHKLWYNIKIKSKIQKDYGFSMKYEAFSSTIARTYANFSDRFCIRGFQRSKHFWN